MKFYEIQLGFSQVLPAYRWVGKGAERFEKALVGITKFQKIKSCMF
jgi:hypothetical protein